MGSLALEPFGGNSRIILSKVWVSVSLTPSEMPDRGSVSPVMAEFLLEGAGGRLPHILS